MSYSYVERGSVIRTVDEGSRINLDCTGRNCGVYLNSLFRIVSILYWRRGQNVSITVLFD